MISGTFLSPTGLLNYSSFPGHGEVRGGQRHEQCRHGWRWNKCERSACLGTDSKYLRLCDCLTPCQDSPIRAKVCLEWVSNCLLSQILLHSSLFIRGCDVGAAAWKFSHLGTVPS